MRILLFAAAIFTIIHFVRIDLVEGTIPSPPIIIEEAQCEDATYSIPVTSIEGDTIKSLFALYPDPNISLIDRLSNFYSLNPHLERQAIVGGDIIKIPLSRNDQDGCTN